MSERESREERKQQILNLCEEAGCNDKIQKIHFDQFVDRKWNPHPPARFKDWWNSVGVKDTDKATERPWTGVDFVRAFNCQAVRDVYSDAKSIGIA